MSNEKTQKIELDGCTLHCWIDGVLRWELNTSDLVLVAEYTTNEGPWLDDYFLVFVTRDKDVTFFHSCSLYVDGEHNVLADLEQQLGANLQLGLLNSTEWNSRIIWPPDIAGRPYFTFREIPANNMWHKLRQRMLGPTQEYFLSDEVKGFLHLT